jgi:hypothetical protein
MVVSTVMGTPSFVFSRYQDRIRRNNWKLISLGVLLTDVCVCVCVCVCVKESWKRTDSATVLVKRTAVEFRNWLDGG